MKKIIIVMAALLLTAFGVSAQQSVKSRNVDEFRRIELTGALTVEMIRSDTAGLDVKVYEVPVDKLVWSVKDGVLSIRLKPGKNGRAEVKLYYEDFNDLRINGSSVLVQDAIDRMMLDVHMQSGSTFGAKLDVKDLVIKVAGNSAAELSGQVKYLTMTANAKSKVNARNLATVDARVSAATNAELYIWAQERLQLSAESGGSIFYRGEPEIFRSVTKMGGTIENVGR